MRGQTEEELELDRCQSDLDAAHKGSACGPFRRDCTDLHHAGTAVTQESHCNRAFTRRSNSTRLQDLVRQSSAPASKHSTLERASLLRTRQITGKVRGAAVARICRQRSAPLMSGISRSRTARSGVVARKRATTSPPLATTTTEWPCSRRPTALPRPRSCRCRRS